MIIIHSGIKKWKEELGNGVDVYRWLTKFARMACDVEFGISFLKEIPSIKNGGRIEGMGEIIHCWDYWNLNTHTHSCFEVCKITHIWWETPILSIRFFFFFPGFVLTLVDFVVPQTSSKKLTDQNPSKSLCRWPERTPRVTLTAEPQTFWGRKENESPFWKDGRHLLVSIPSIFLGGFWTYPGWFPTTRRCRGFVRIWTECFICQYVKKRHPPSKIQPKKLTVAWYPFHPCWLRDFIPRKCWDFRGKPFKLESAVKNYLSPPKKGITVTDEGLGCDFLLKMVQNPGGHWNPGWGVDRSKL